MNKNKKQNNETENKTLRSMNNWIYIGDKCMKDDFETKQWFSFCTFELGN